MTTRTRFAAGVATLAAALAASLALAGLGSSAEPAPRVDTTGVLPLPTVDAPSGVLAPLLNREEN